MAVLDVELGPLPLQNPILPASGCFGPELAGILPLSRLGGVVTKTVFSGTRSGNPAHRLMETEDGMLNAVGIPSTGAGGFRSSLLPGYLAARVPLFVSVGGLAVEEYWAIVDELSDVPFDALEVNVSCPNLELGGLEIGADPEQLRRVTEGIVARTDQPVVVKLTPNVTRVEELAQAAEAGGAAALTVANTYVGIAIDVHQRSAILGNSTGGLSGPAIKPLSLELVWTVTQSVNIPVIGCGGIASATDVVEYMMAGATAVQVGTATFTRPDTMLRILDELPPLLTTLDEDAVQNIIGTVHHSDSTVPDVHDRSTAAATDSLARQGHSYEPA